MGVLPFEASVTHLGGAWSEYGWLTIVLALGLASTIAARRAGELNLTRFRTLFPAWRFFDRPTPLIHLHARYQPVQRHWSPWDAVLPPCAPTLSDFFAAPNSLHQLALQTVVERLASESQDAASKEQGDDVKNLASYRHISHLVATWALDRCRHAINYEFRLDAHIFSEHDDPSETQALTILIAPSTPIEKSAFLDESDRIS
jgi:hypothetical protein